MTSAVRERGYQSLAIDDHTPNAGAVPALTADGVRRQSEELAVATARLG